MILELIVIRHSPENIGMIRIGLRVSSIAVNAQVKSLPVPVCPTFYVLWAEEVLADQADTDSSRCLAERARWVPAGQKRGFRAAKNSTQRIRAAPNRNAKRGLVFRDKLVLQVEEVLVQKASFGLRHSLFFKEIMTKETRSLLGNKAGAPRQRLNYPDRTP